MLWEYYKIFMWFAIMVVWCVYNTWKWRMDFLWLCVCIVTYTLACMQIHTRVECVAHRMAVRCTTNLVDWSNIVIWWRTTYWVLTTLGVRCTSAALTLTEPWWVCCPNSVPYIHLIMTRLATNLCLYSNVCCDIKLLSMSTNVCGPGGTLGAHTITLGLEQPHLWGTGPTPGGFASSGS